MEEKVSNLLNQKSSQEQKRRGEDSRCCNCDRKFTKDCLPTRQFYYEFYEDGAQVKKHVLIRDAIKEIYQWRLFGFSEKEAEETFGSIQIRVCGSVCGIAIAKLYGAIKVFDSLAHASSELHFLTKKMLDGFMSFANQCVTGEPVDKTKLPPNLLTRNVKGKKDEKNGIGSHILNRPLTQHLNLQKGQITPTLNPPEYPMTLLGSTEFESSLAEKTKDENKDADYNNYNSGGEYGENEENELSEIEGMEEEEPPSPKSIVIKPFLCQLCGAGLTSRQGLRTHELLTHKVGNREKVFVCEHCGKEFFFDYLLKNHLTKHILTRDYPCPTCDLKFKGKRCLYQHQRDVHATLEKRFNCNICSKSFKHKRTLWDHKKCTHGYKGKRILFNCKFGCGSTSNRNRSMLAHYRRCLKRPLEGQKEVEAAVESIGGVQAEDLEKAEEGVGKRKKIYTCLWDCGKMFTCKGYREKHCKRVCRKRPNQKKQFSATHPRNRKVITVPNPSASALSSSSSFVQDAKVCPAGEVPDKDTPTSEPIEVETVFDEMIGIL